jgi:DNA-binding MarR family transcriptional regulator
MSSVDDAEVRPPSLLGMPSYLAGHVSRIGRLALGEVLDEHRLKFPEFAALLALYDLGPMPQFEVAERLELNRSHLVGYLDALEGMGYVERFRDQRDRRRQLVGLTDLGKGFTKRLLAQARSSQAEYLRVLSAAEQATLSDLLRRVLRAYDQKRTARPEQEAAG